MITVNDGIITKYYDKKDNFPALAEVGDYFIVTPNGTVSRWQAVAMECLSTAML